MDLSLLDIVGPLSSRHLGNNPSVPIGVKGGEGEDGVEVLLMLMHNGTHLSILNAEVSFGGGGRLGGGKIE